MPGLLEGTAYVDDPIHGEEVDIAVEVVIDGYPASWTDPAAYWVDEVTAKWGDTGEELTPEEMERHEEAIDQEVDLLTLDGDFVDAW